MRSGDGMGPGPLSPGPSPVRSPTFRPDTGEGNAGPSRTNTDWQGRTQMAGWRQRGLRLAVRCDLAPWPGFALPDQSWEAGTDSEGVRAELRGAGVVVGPQLPAGAPRLIGGHGRLPHGCSARLNAGEWPRGAKGPWRTTAAARRGGTHSDSTPTEYRLYTREASC